MLKITTTNGDTLIHADQQPDAMIITGYDGSRVMVHAKEWGRHKYIRKEGNRYIYPEDLKKGVSAVGNAISNKAKQTKQNIKSSVGKAIDNAEDRMMDRALNRMEKNLGYAEKMMNKFENSDTYKRLDAKYGSGSEASKKFDREREAALKDMKKRQDDFDKLWKDSETKIKDSNYSGKNNFRDENSKKVASQIENQKAKEERARKKAQLKKKVEDTEARIEKGVEAGRKREGTKRAEERFNTKQRVRRKVDGTAIETGSESYEERARRNKTTAQQKSAHSGYETDKKKFPEGGSTEELERQKEKTKARKKAKNREAYLKKISTRKVKHPGSPEYYAEKHANSKQNRW